MGGCCLLAISEKLFVELPTGLLLDQSLRPEDIALYAQIQLRPGCSISELNRLTCRSRTTIRSQCKRLAQGGWIAVVSEGIKKSVYPTLSDEHQRQVSELYKEQVRLASRVGQTHMCEWLRILLDVPSILENVRPWFLQNPETGEYLEYDCYLPEPYQVAWEFHGQQHFTVTEMFPDEEALRKLQMRDLVKVSQSKKHGVNW